MVRLSLLTPVYAHRCWQHLAVALESPFQGRSIPWAALTACLEFQPLDHTTGSLRLRVKPSLTSDQRRGLRTFIARFADAIAAWGEALALQHAPVHGAAEARRPRRAVDRDEAIDDALAPLPLPVADAIRTATQSEMDAQPDLIWPDAATVGNDALPAGPWQRTGWWVELYGAGWPGNAERNILRNAEAPSYVDAPPYDGRIDVPNRLLLAGPQQQASGGFFSPPMAYPQSVAAAIMELLNRPGHMRGLARLAAAAPAAAITDTGMNAGQVSTGVMLLVEEALEVFLLVNALIAFDRLWRPRAWPSQWVWTLTGRKRRGLFMHTAPSTDPTDPLRAALHLPVASLVSEVLASGKLPAWAADGADGGGQPPPPPEQLREWASDNLVVDALAAVDRDTLAVRLGPGVVEAARWAWRVLYQWHAWHLLCAHAAGRDGVTPQWENVFRDVLYYFGFDPYTSDDAG